jgi:hypothetical protein
LRLLLLLLLLLSRHAWGYRPCQPAAAQADAHILWIDARAHISLHPSYRAKVA